MQRDLEYVSDLAYRPGPGAFVHPDLFTLSSEPELPPRERTARPGALVWVLRVLWTVAIGLGILAVGAFATGHILECILLSPCAGGFAGIARGLDSDTSWLQARRAIADRADLVDRQT